MSKLITKRYMDTMRDAALLHSPCKEIANRIWAILDLLNKEGVRVPNDWMYEYGAAAEFRWHDNRGPRFGGCTGYVGLIITADKLSIRGRTGPDKYSNDGGITINGLDKHDAVVLVKTLIGVIDRAAEAKEESDATKIEQLKSTLDTVKHQRTFLARELASRTSRGVPDWLMESIPGGLEVAEAKEKCDA